MTERVLAIVAHPDDEAIGCGGTLARHAAQGDAISVVVFADGVTSRGASPSDIQKRHRECREACRILGTEDVFIHQYRDNQLDTLPLLQLTQHVETHLARFRPTVVYTHWIGDLNIDHRIVADAVRVACRAQPGQTVRRLLHFEVVCSTGWAGGFSPEYFVLLGASHIGAKHDALRCYGEELRPEPHPRSEQNIVRLLHQRGAQCGAHAAEAFVVGKVIV